MTCHIMRMSGHSTHCGLTDLPPGDSYVEDGGREYMADCRKCVRAAGRHRDEALAELEAERGGGEKALFGGRPAVCVFCGSRPGRSLRYVSEARALGAGLAAARVPVVYGGASVGLIGAMADSVLEAGGDIAAVVPECLYEPGSRHPGVAAMIEEPDLHERKRRMFGMSSAFVAMPGGVGTFDEILEVMAWTQLRDGGVEAKPLFLLNVDGFFDRLVGALMHSVEEGFAQFEVVAVEVFADAAALVEAVRSALAS